MVLNPKGELIFKIDLKDKILIDDEYKYKTYIMHQTKESKIFINDYIMSIKEIEDILYCNQCMLDLLYLDKGNHFVLRFINEGKEIYLYEASSFCSDDVETKFGVKICDKQAKSFIEYLTFVRNKMIEDESNEN